MYKQHSKMDQKCNKNAIEIYQNAQQIYQNAQEYTKK